MCSYSLSTPDLSWGGEAWSPCFFDDRRQFYWRHIATFNLKSQNVTLSLGWTYLALKVFKFGFRFHFWQLTAITDSEFLCSYAFKLGPWQLEDHMPFTVRPSRTSDAHYDWLGLGHYGRPCTYVWVRPRDNVGSLDEGLGHSNSRYSMSTFIYLFQVQVTVHAPLSSSYSIFTSVFIYIASCPHNWHRDV